jgi:hypothetical protein
MLYQLSYSRVATNLVPCTETENGRPVTRTARSPLRMRPDQPIVSSYP